MVKTHPLNVVGQKYHDYVVMRVVEIPELQCVLKELMHIPTKAWIMHIANDDRENLFSLSFRTLPESSNGVAHILEHTVLCGSKKYPIRDPFFSMNRRSLNTFMNALTGSDFTCYPASSQIPKDFYNILEVYLDAVFKPILSEFSFAQEGHRLEFAIPSDPKSALEYKGIVYNEMKGALSSPIARLNEIINHELFPDLTYGFDAGGDPKDIPQLTYEELKAFHDKFYHPSRCLFFFYGNIPLAQHLDFLTEHAFKDVKALDPLPPLPLQKRFLTPKTIKKTYPISPDEETLDKSIIAFSWLTCPIADQEELLGIQILEIILMDTDASLLKKALLKSGLCKQAYSFIESDFSEVPFAIILKGCQSENADEIKLFVFKTLENIADRNIPFELVENAMHQLEFYRSEITGDQSPFGLSLFMRSALLRQHGVNPENGLMIHSLFEGLRKKILANPSYLNDLIKKHFINNSHHVYIILEPDAALAPKEQIEEQTLLNKIKENLSETEKNAIVRRSEELAKYQQSEENDNIEILPKLELKDVPKTARDYSLSVEQHDQLQVYHHACFTNEIVYADLVFDLPYIKEEDLPYVRLLSSLLPQIGAGDRTYEENLEFIQAHTGGVGASLSFNLQATDHNHIQPSISIRTKALYKKVPKMFSLLQDLAEKPNFFEAERLKELIIKNFVSIESSINQGALKYAINLSASGLNEASKIANIWYGLGYFWKLKEIAQNIDHELPKLMEKLQYLRKKILCVNTPHLILSCDAEMYDKIKAHKFYGLVDLDTNKEKKWKSVYPLEGVKPQGRVISAPVAFIGKVFPTVSYIHPHSPALHIASFLMDNLVLHTRIREQGGAYGGGAVSNALSGNFYFYSYRDPNIASTLDAFDLAINEILEGNFDEEDLIEAKMEMVQGMDSPVAPGSRADLAYSWMREGKIPAIRQAYRSKLLALTKEEIIEAVKEQIVINYPLGSTVVFADRGLLEKENLILALKGQPVFDIEKI